MAKCDIEVLLDAPDRVYRAGEPIRGRVRVRVNADCQCDGLDVSIDFHTHGKGNSTARAVQKFRLFVGQWAAGQAFEYPFELTAPREPIPYAGTLLNVGFRVQATADIPWAFDPKAAAAVRIVHEPPPGGLDISWNERLLKSSSNGGCLAFSVALLAIGALLLGFAVVANEEDLLGFICPLGVFGFIGLIATLPGYLSNRALGGVRMELRQGTQGGYREAQEEGALFAAIHTRNAANAERVMVTFEILEQVVRGSGTNSTTYRHPLHTDTIALERVGAGHFEARLPLPRGGQFPYSFSAPSNQIIWRLTGHVVIPGWPDWKKVVPLVAKPTR